MPRKFNLFFQPLKSGFISNMYASRWRFSNHIYYPAFRNFHFRDLSREANYQYKKYERSLCKAKKLKERKKFLHRCLEEQVLPRSIKIELHWDFKPFHHIKKEILLDRINAIKYQIEQTYRQVRKNWGYLKFYVNRQTFDILVSNAHKFAHHQAFLNRKSLQKKLNNLIRFSIWYDFTIPENIINMSSQQLSFLEKRVLGLGLSFGLSPTKRDVVPTAAAFDQFLYLKRNKIKNPDVIRGLVSPLLLSIRNESPVLPRRLDEALAGLEKRRDIKIMPADKGGKIVIMNTSDYEAKISELLADVQTYEEVHHNPLNNINKNIRAQIKNISHRCPDKKYLYRFLATNCSLSYIYGIPKIHKDNCPLRPIISNIGTIQRPIAGWLASLLTPYLGKFSEAHLMNSYQFKQKIKDFAAAQSTNLVKMVSLDVISLFTKVPIDNVIDFLGRKIDQKQIELPIPKDCFLELIRLCTNNNYFQFQDRFFKQKFGISMGSPLSPVLANLFMEYFESELLPTIGPQPKLWLRYVDDIFMLWPNDQDFNAFFNKVNDLVPSIKFTTEWENSGKMPFLDTKVHRLSSGFSLGIYRKPTHSNQYIHYFSWQSESIKKSSAFSLFYRAHRLCDFIYLEQEIA